mgnify:CR=1 FL=1
MINLTLPPVISTLFINTEFIGTYDNPLDLMDAIDISLEQEDKEKFSDVSNWQDVKVEIYFSLVNDSDSTSKTYLVTEKDIEDKNDITKIYDAMIQKYTIELEYKFNNDDEYSEMMCE